MAFARQQPHNPSSRQSEATHTPSTLPDRSSIQRSPMALPTIMQLQRLAGNRAVTQMLTSALKQQSSRATSGQPPVQRAIDKNTAESRLRALLKNHGLEDRYSDFRQTARTIADDKDTTEKNIDDLLYAVPALHTLFMNARMTLTESNPKNTGNMDQKTKEIYEKIHSFMYFHATSQANAPGILENGLNPKKGGVDGGISDVSSINAEERSKNVSRSKGYSYVTRHEAEAKGYKSSLEGKQVPATILHSFVAPEYSEDFALDEDSKTGLKTSTGMKAIGSGGQLNPEALKLFYRALGRKYSQEDINQVYHDHF